VLGLHKKATKEKNQRGGQHFVLAHKNKWQWGQKVGKVQSDGPGGGSPKNRKRQKKENQNK